MCAAHLQLALLLGLALVLGPGGDGAAADGVEEDSIHGADSVEEDSIQGGGRAKEDSVVTLMRSFGLRTPDPLATASPHWKPLCGHTHPGHQDRSHNQSDFYCLSPPSVALGPA